MKPLLNLSTIFLASDVAMRAMNGYGIRGHHIKVTSDAFDKNFTIESVKQESMEINDLLVNESAKRPKVGWNRQASMNLDDPYGTRDLALT